MVFNIVSRRSSETERYVVIRPLGSSLRVNRVDGTYLPLISFVQDVDWFVTAPDWPKSGSQVVSRHCRRVCVQFHTTLQVARERSIGSVLYFTQVVDGALCILQTRYSIIH